MTSIQFGRYELLERLGASPVAEIFRARSIGAAGFAKIVAIKRIHQALERDEEFVRLFVEEARVSASLTHANIAQVFDFGRVDGTHFLAMEYLAGIDLAGILRQASKGGNPLPLPLALHIAHAVASGLAYAHSRSDPTGKPLGILHLGVNPQNIIISFEGAVKLTDFGIGRARSRLADLHREESRQLAYISPEQLAGAEPDARSDVFSLGCALFECALGQPAFAAASGRLTIERVRQGAVKRPRELRPELPEEAEQIILSALARDPERRFSSASELERAIESFTHRTRMTFSTNQLARWLRVNIDAPTRPGTTKRSQAADDNAPRRPAVSPAIARREAVTSSSLSSNELSLPDLLADHAPASAPTTKGHLPSAARSAARRKEMSRTRLGVGTSPVLPQLGPQGSLGDARVASHHPAADAATRASTAHGQESAQPAPPRPDFSDTDSMPAAAVDLTATEPERQEIVELTESDDRAKTVGQAPTVLLEDLTSENAGPESPPQDPPATDDQPPDDEQLLREAAALQWDDGPTILDPREEPSRHKQSAPARLTAPLAPHFVVTDEDLDLPTQVEGFSPSTVSHEEPSIPELDQQQEYPGAASSAFVATDEALDVPTRVEEVPASLLAEALGTLPQRLRIALANDAPATQEHEALSLATPVDAALADTAPDDALNPRGDADLYAEPPAPAAPQAVSATPIAAPSKGGVGYLLPSLAIVSLVLLVVGAALVYLLISQGTEDRFQPRVEVIPSADEEHDVFTSRPLIAEQPPRRSGEPPAETKTTEPAPAVTQEAATAKPTRPRGAEDQQPRARAERSKPSAETAPSAGQKVRGKRQTATTKARAVTAHAARRKNTIRAHREAKRPPPTKQSPADVPRGFLIIASRPNAQVLVDGKSTGRETPVRPSNPLALTPGTHRITLLVRGQKFNFKVSIQPNETARLVRVLPLP